MIRYGLQRIFHIGTALKYYIDCLNNIMQVITIMHTFRSTLGYFSVS